MKTDKEKQTVRCFVLDKDYKAVKMSKGKKFTSRHFRKDEQEEELLEEQEIPADIDVSDDDGNEVN